jgi:hypothetical protein
MGINPPGIPEIIKTPTIESSEQHLRSIDQIKTEAITSHKIAMEQMSKHIISDFKPFTLGQPVWLEAKNLRLSYPSKKIAPKCHGPFKVK